MPSRRLGRSLGIDVVPFKTCTFSCVYCQVGRTPRPTTERGEYLTLDKLRTDLAVAVERCGDFDVATFSGSGEPTLNSRLGEMILHVKEVTGKPAVVITNGSLLWMPDVRSELAGADVVCPSLDFATEETFRKVNRPSEELDYQTVMDGIVTFCRGFEGEIRLEVFLVAGNNDSEEEVALIAEAAKRMGPVRVELNSAERRPAETWVGPVGHERLVELSSLFDPPAAVIVRPAVSDAAEAGGAVATEAEVLAYLERGAASVAEIAGALGATVESVRGECKALCATGRATVEATPEGERYLVHE